MQLSAQLCSVAIGGGASATSSGAQKHVRGQVRRILEHFLPRLFGFGQSHGSAQSPLFRFFSHFLSVFVFEYGHQDAPCAHESDTSADMRRQHYAHGRVVFKKLTRLVQQGAREANAGAGLRAIRHTVALAMTSALL